MHYVAAVNALQKENGLKLDKYAMQEWMCLHPRFAQVIWLNTVGKKKSDTF